MKKAIFAAAMAAAMTLCSCGSVKHDVKEDYKEYLDYAFDGKYSISEPMDQKTDDTSERVWLVDYTDVNGEEQTGEITVIISDDDDEELIKSEYDWAVLNFVMTRVNRTVQEELLDKLVSQHFEVTDGSVWTYKGEGFAINIELISCDLFNPDSETLAAALDPESGVKYAGVTLKEWAQNESNGLSVRIVLEDSSRTAEFMDKLADLGGDYVEYTVSPQNYCFELHAPDESGTSQLVAAGCRVLGEETDASFFGVEYIRSKTDKEA